MTILYAAALQDAAILGSDGRRTNIGAGLIETFDKTVHISPAIAAAKFGYGGPDADVIWDRIKQLSPSDLEDIEALLPKARLLGEGVYRQQRTHFAMNGQPDWGMTLIFASYDDRGAGLHWIDYRDNHGLAVSAWRRDYAREIVIAKGPVGADEVARVAVASNAGSSAIPVSLAPRQWAKDVVLAAGALGQTVGPPAFVRVISADGQSHSMVGPDDIIADPIRYRL